jgi:hypothetical protein
LGLVAAVALGALAAGCNAILGNDVHELAKSGVATGSAGTGSGNGGAATGAGGSVGGGASGSGGIGTGGTTGGSPGSDASDDAPAPVCTGSVKECQGRTLRQCSGGQWVDLLQCPYACVGEVCTGSCVPMTKQCVQNTPQTCDAGGNWVSATPCPAICSLGECTGMCVPGTMQACGSAATCNAFAMQICDLTGTWSDCTPAPGNCLAIPTGWQAVAMAQQAGGCPQGFGSPQTYYTKATGDPFTCQCQCGGTQKCSGTVTLNEYDPLGGPNCTGTPNKSTLTVTPACGSGGPAIDQTKSYTISDMVYGPQPACVASPKGTVMPPVVTESTTLCSANGTCPGGACLSLLEGRNLCVSHAGDVPCPMGFATATVMSATYDDGRTCGACSCGSTLGCTLTGVQLNNSSPNCATNHPYWMNATETCTQAPASFPLNATKALGSSTGDGTCVETSPSQPTGIVHLNVANTITVCCR